VLRWERRRGAPVHLGLVPVSLVASPVILYFFIYL
jgi:hypothetical protein